MGNPSQQDKDFDEGYKDASNGGPPKGTAMLDFREPSEDYLDGYRHGKER